MTGDEWLSTVRIARDLGSAALLLPDGITDLTDMPQPIHEAISMALVYLSWEEMPEEDQPPKRIWLDQDRLREWGREVKRRHGRRGTSWDDSDIEDPVQNAFATELKAKLRG